MDERFGDVGSRVVTRLNLQTGCLERTQPLPRLALRPAVATSSSSIAVCGGISNGTTVANCHSFSAVTEKYVDFHQIARNMGTLTSQNIKRLFLVMVWLATRASNYHINSVTFYK